jgi:hypothetical protein
MNLCIYNDTTFALDIQWGNFGKAHDYFWIPPVLQLKITETIFCLLQSNGAREFAIRVTDIPARKPALHLIRRMEYNLTARIIAFKEVNIIGYTRAK